MRTAILLLTGLLLFTYLISFIISIVAGVEDFFRLFIVIVEVKIIVLGILGLSRFFRREEDALIKRFSVFVISVELIIIITILLAEEFMIIGELLKLAMAIPLLIIVKKYKVRAGTTS